LIEAIWDSIAATPEAVPVPQWHKDILDNRLADKNAVSDTWKNVKKRLG
ncbi:MAG: addiction module protein, partial [Gammaproteobacteria bacterium]|nr:addiction module protein [Gammaproteobacteria bacterium]